QTDLHLSLESLLIPSRQQQHTSLSPFFLSCYRPHPHLHSFPTRRSSDLTHLKPCFVQINPDILISLHGLSSSRGRKVIVLVHVRSEDHTSELQSGFDLVCRLLLEKKNKITTTPIRRGYAPNARLHM